MKKKIILFLFLLSTLFVITGCGGSESGENTNGNNSSKGNEIVKVGKYDVKINKLGSFVEMKYKYPDSALASNAGTYNTIDYMDKKDFVFRIGMYFFEGKTVEETMKETTLTSLEKITYGEYTWNVYQGKQDDEKNVLSYITQVGSNSYTISFISDYDMKNFADTFMKSVKFN